MKLCFVSVATLAAITFSNSAAADEWAVKVDVEFPIACTYAQYEVKITCEARNNPGQCFSASRVVSTGETTRVFEPTTTFRPDHGVNLGYGLRPTERMTVFMESSQSFCASSVTCEGEAEANVEGSWRSASNSADFDASLSSACSRWFEENTVKIVNETIDD